MCNVVAPCSWSERGKQYNAKVSLGCKIGINPRTAAGQLEKLQPCSSRLQFDTVHPVPKIHHQQGICSVSEAPFETVTQFFFKPSKKKSTRQISGQMCCYFLTADARDECKMII